MNFFKVLNANVYIYTFLMLGKMIRLNYLWKVYGTKVLNDESCFFSVIFDGGLNCDIMVHEKLFILLKLTFKILTVYAIINLIISSQAKQLLEPYDPVI